MSNWIKFPVEKVKGRLRDQNILKGKEKVHLWKEQGKQTSEGLIPQIENILLFNRKKHKIIKVIKITIMSQLYANNNIQKHGC